MSQPKSDTEIFEIIKNAHSLLVIQSDRPDGDSLSSALFLESVLCDAGKEVDLYCAVTMPEYLRFIPGWDRVSNELPVRADATIVVDNASLVLLEKFDTSHDSLPFKTRPFIIADHHTEVSCDIPYATHHLTRPHYSSAGELLYEIFTEQGYEISVEAKKLVMQSILSDTLGLTNDLATAKTYRIMADLIDSGVERSALEDARRLYAKMDQRVFRYKAELIKRTEFSFDDAVAICVIPENESYDIGTLYNPGPLILSELLMVKNVKVAIALKTYHNRATAAIRCTYGTNIAHELAELFGGGGHPYSAGFRVDSYSGDLALLKRDIITAVGKLLQ